MATYYKSRDPGSPVVYIQGDDRWYSYAYDGLLRESAGLLPETIRAQCVDISQDEATTLMTIIRAEAERIVQGRAEATRYPSSPPSPPRSHRPRWLPYALAGGVVVVALVVLIVLAATGGFGGGSGAPAVQAGAASTGVPGVLSADAIAAVGGTSISRRQLDQRAADFEAIYAGQIPNKTSDPAKYKLFQQAVLEYMITYELVSQKAQQLNITVTDQDVQTWIDSIIKEAFSGDQAGFDASLQQQGITVDQLKRSYKESALFQKVYAQVTKDITTVPDSDILAYYNAHTGDTMRASRSTTSRRRSRTRFWMLCERKHGRSGSNRREHSRR